MKDEDIEARLTIVHLELEHLREELARAWTEIYRLKEESGRARTPLDLRGQMLPKKEPR